MKKKFLILILILFLKINVFSNNIYYNFINTKNFLSYKIASITLNNNVLFKLNDLSKIFNFNYQFNPFTKTISFKLNKNKISTYPNSKLILINQKITNLPDSLKYFNSSVYLSLNLIKKIPNLINKISNRDVFFVAAKKNNDLSLDDLIKEKIISYNKKNKKIKHKLLTTIIIDPGHGGKDPGAIGYSKIHYEKDIVLSVAKKIQKVLKKNHPDLKILLTRSTDEFLSLQKRAKIANDNKGDLFISLHCNAGFSKARGFEIYYFSLNENDQVSRTVRLYENSVKKKYKHNSNKSIVNFIKTDMAQINYINKSIDIAKVIQTNMSYKLHANNRGIKGARFYVLKDVFMPAMLVEIGFITNKYEEQLLINQDYEDKIANCINNAISEIKNEF